MKKLIITVFVLCSFALTGCQQVTKDMIHDSYLSDYLQQVEQKQILAPNHNKTYYSYYLEPSIGRYESDASSNIFGYNGTKILMNLNVSSIVNQKYYTDAITVNNSYQNIAVLAQYNGSYLDYQENTHSYNVTIYDFAEQCAVILSSDTVNMYAITNVNESVDIAGIMLKIARSTSINHNEIIAHYSSKETTTITQNRIDLFDSIAPENGRIEELFDGYEQNHEEQNTHQITEDDE